MTNICHLTLLADLENQGQTYFQMTFWLNTCFRLDFSIDFNIIKVEELSKPKTDNVTMMIN